MGPSGQALGKLTAGIPSICRPLYLLALILSMSSVWEAIWLSGINDGVRPDCGRRDLRTGRVYRAQYASDLRRRPDCDYRPLEIHDNTSISRAEEVKIFSYLVDRINGNTNDYQSRGAYVYKEVEISTVAVRPSQRAESYYVQAGVPRNNNDCCMRGGVNHMVNFLV